MTDQNTEESLWIAHLFAEKLREEAVPLTRTWLDALVRRLGDVHPTRVFPTESLLNHIPTVLARLADYLELDTDALDHGFVTDDLGRLAKLRRSQGYGLEELQAEFFILSRLLFGAAREFVGEAPGVDPRHLVDLLERLQHATREIAATTTLAYSEAALEDRRQRAEILERFGQVISHEIKNRLNLARLAIANWQRHSSDADADDLEMVETVVLSLNGIETVAEDVRGLAVAQVLPDSSWGRRRPLSDVVERLIESVAPMAAERAVRVRIEGELPRTAVDASKLELALVNLLINGARHAGEGSTSSTVTVSGRQIDDGLEIYVEDDGSGVPDALRDQVFERGSRASKDTPGDGLGLAIAREAVEQIGGTIELDAAYSEGCRFIVRLDAPPEDLAD